MQHGTESKMTKNKSTPTKKKIIFLHPDLGIGGAERLVIDAALAYQQSGHDVHIITNHHDKTRCFRETLDQLSVQVVASWFPRSIFGKAMAICAYIRLTLATFYLICFGKLNDQTCEPNAVFVDQISAPLPFLRWFARFVSSDDKFKIIFYGHFPDQLLAVNRTTRLARLYRAPIDWFEQWANRFADLMLVNSRFTERVFRQTFPTLVNFPMHVVYPACNFASLNIEQQADLEQEKNEPKEADWKSESTVFLSLNRFERKKNIGLAIEALSELVHNHHETAVKLLIAGGYDLRIKENVDYEFELKQLARKLNVDKQVFFVRSPNDMMKARLIRSCHVLLYTPENEHFGIVPLEAMYCSRPVLSAASGGPLETVVNGQTGYHCESNITDWAQKMLRLHSDHETAHALGQAGRKHVLANFAFEAFQQQMNQVWEL